MRRRREIEAARRRLSVQADRLGEQALAALEVDAEAADEALREQQQLIAVIHALGWVIGQQDAVLRKPRKRLTE